MTTWVYAFAETTDARRAAGRLPPGLGAGPVRLLPIDTVTAAIGDAPLEAPAGLEPLLRHEHVVEVLGHFSDAVLPARFATRLPNDAAVITYAECHMDALRSALHRVRDRAEFAVHFAAAPASPPEPDTPASAEPMTGRDWLARRVAARQDDDNLRAVVHAALAPLATDAVWRPAEPDRRPASAAYLVDKGHICEFRSRLDALGRETDRLRLTLTGPWPPYSFCALEPAR